MLAAAAMLLAGAAAAQTADPKVKADTFTNPLLPSGPDPSVHREGDTYYYMHTLGDRLEIWRTKDITDLANAERKLVWQAPSQPASNGVAIWAPELHRIHGSCRQLEDLPPRVLSGHAFGQALAGPGREGDAVAAVADGVPDLLVGLGLRDARHHVVAHVHPAPPRIVDLDAGERWELARDRVGEPLSSR